MSYQPHYKNHPVPAVKVKGLYTYCGSASNQFSLQDTGGSHRWSTSSDRDGKTLCTTPMSGHMINWKEYRFVRVPVKGQMSSYNIAKACKKAKLEPLCDHSTYSDGKCLVAGANWHFSVPSVNKQHGVPVEFMQGAYLYCSNANGDKSLLNTGTTHRWTTHKDRDGDTICARELKSFNQDFEYHEHKVKRVEVKGKMTSYNIAKACKSEGLRPLCDHNSYMDGTCVLLNDAWHFSHPSNVRSQSGLEQSKLLGAYFYCGSGNAGKSLENLGNTHAWTTNRDRNGETYCTKARAGEKSEWEEYHFERVAVKGKMNSYNINKACTAAKMRPLCDHGSYFDGKCLLAGENWHFSVPKTIKSKGIDADFFRGAYLYCGSSNHGKSLLNTGTSHRWTVDKDKNGDTICARMKKDFDPDFEYQGHKIKRVTVKGDMGSENILKTCKANDLMPLCDHSSYMNGRCVLVGENWHFSHPSHVKARSGLDQRKLLGVYVYSGNGNGGKTLKNIGNTHSWSDSNNRDGETLCTKPKDGEKLTWNGLKLLRVRVNGPMTSPSILAACKAKKMTPVCDHPSYANGQCIKPSGYTSHMSQPGTNRQFGLNTEFTKGVYFYCGKANHQWSLLNTGTSHRWSAAKDYGGETICGVKQ